MTVNETAILYRKSPKMLAAINELIANGFGENLCMVYKGTACAMHKTSNAYRLKKAWKAMTGKDVVAESIGARAGKRRNDGHYVVCALA